MTFKERPSLKTLSALRKAKQQHVNSCNISQGTPQTFPLSPLPHNTGSALRPISSNLANLRLSDSKVDGVSKQSNSHTPFNLTLALKTKCKSTKRDTESRETICRVNETDRELLLSGNENTQVDHSLLKIKSHTSGVGLVLSTEYPSIDLIKRCLKDVVSVARIYLRSDMAFKFDRPSPDDVILSTLSSAKPRFAPRWSQ